jgi:hypothetical protein
MKANSTLKTDYAIHRSSGSIFFKKGAKTYVSKPTINGISKINFGNGVDCQMTADQRETFIN